MESVHLKAVPIGHIWNTKTFRIFLAKIIIKLFTCTFYVYHCSDSLFYSIREMSVVPRCMEEQEHLIFSTVHLCSIRYLPRLWGPLHSTAESQPELDQRFFLVQHPVSDSAKMPENKSRTNSAFKGFASSSTEYSRMLTSFDWLLTLCLMQPRVGFGL